jgi:hypothetical protein
MTWNQEKLDKVVRKKNDSETKKNQIQRNINNLSSLEDFVNSDWYKEFLEVLLLREINKYTDAILNDESAEANKIQYSMKTVNIKVRKFLLALATHPINTLKMLSSKIDKLGSTE